MILELLEELSKFDIVKKSENTIQWVIHNRQYSSYSSETWTITLSNGIAHVKCWYSGSLQQNYKYDKKFELSDYIYNKVKQFINCEVSDDDKFSNLLIEKIKDLNPDFNEKPFVRNKTIDKIIDGK